MLLYTVKSLDEVEEALRPLYVAKDGVFVLNTDPTQSSEFQKLQSSRDQILEEKRKEKQRVEEMEAAQRAEHIKTLESEKKFEEALEAERLQHQAALTAAQQSSVALAEQLKSTLMDAQVNSLAAELAGTNAPLLIPHLRARVEVKESEGRLKLFVKDASGSIIDKTLEALGEEFKQNKLYAPILAGRDSSGGSGGGTGGSGTPPSEWEQYFKPETANRTKQIELSNADPELYKQLSKKYPRPRPVQGAVR